MRPMGEGPSQEGVDEKLEALGYRRFVVGRRGKRHALDPCSPPLTPITLGGRPGGRTLANAHLPVSAAR